MRAVAAAPATQEDAQRRAAFDALQRSTAQRNQRTQARPITATPSSSSPTPQTQQQQPIGAHADGWDQRLPPSHHHRTGPRCSWFTLLLIFVLLVLFLIGYVVLTDRTADLSRRLRAIEKMHANDILFNAGSDAGSGGGNNNGKRNQPFPQLSPSYLQQALAASTTAPIANSGSGGGDNDFDKLLSAGRSSVERGENGALTRFGANAAAMNSLARQASSSVADSSTALNTQRGIEAHHYSFTIEQSASTDSPAGVRIPPIGSVENLWLDRLLSFSVCCRVEMHLTCPPADQISAIVRANPEADEQYLRVLVRNPIYFNRPCILYWVLSPEDEPKETISRKQLLDVGGNTTPEGKTTN